MKNAKVELFYHVTTSCNAYLFQLDSTPHLSSQLSLWDTPGHPDYKHNRILFLSTWPVLKPDVILLVISIDDPDFLSELEDDVSLIRLIYCET
jgi:GTPase SAR1 family protein